MAPTELKMENISISFPGVKALDEVDFKMETGSVHALIGANGAGKSTLMKVLSGAYSHYTGEILIDDKIAKIRSPKDAKKHGIQIVYQEVDTALIPYLTVGENIMLNNLVQDMDKKQWVSYSSIHQKATGILQKLDIQVSSKQLVSSLTLAEKQMVLIARAISKECKFLILDEPTAPLSQGETDKLFQIVRQLQEQNVGIIFISHRLVELFDICDEITVMRNGKFISRDTIKSISINQIVEKMLGKKLDEQFPKMEKIIGETVLTVSHLSDNKKVKDVSFTAKTGEIIGLAGLVGAGKTEICKALFGATEKVKGTITYKDKTFKNKNPKQAVARRFAFVPEERRKEGILVSGFFSFKTFYWGLF